MVILPDGGGPQCAGRAGLGASYVQWPGAGQRALSLLQIGAANRGVYLRPGLN